MWEFLESITRGKVAGWRKKMPLLLAGKSPTMTTPIAASPVRATRDNVLEAIKAFLEHQSKPFFTTQDIARHMGVDEYPVRAAVSWLARYGMIEIVPGVRSKRYLPPLSDRRRHSDSYSVSVYQVKEQAAPADFAALNRLFGYG